MPLHWVDKKRNFDYWPPKGKHISTYLKHWAKPSPDWQIFPLIETKKEADEIIFLSTTEEDEAPISGTTFSYIKTQ